ncbi:MAG: hypothetical protein ACYDDU_20935 [Dermatophilaceae bacterium]|jgi:hypothetical protein
MSTNPPATPLAAAVTLLDRAGRECTARGDTASSDLDDLAIWHLDANLVRIAAETLRAAADAPLPELPAFEPAAGLDPLELLRAARDELQDVPDDLANVPLFLGRIRMSTALFAVRSHYE